jgi:hypothetical protein
MSEQTPGQALRTALDRMLPPGVRWDERELATLDLVEHAANRLAVLRKRFDVKAGHPEITESALASLQTAIHQLEGDLFRWTKSLDPTMETAKSMRHQHAANSRWHGSA